MTNTKLIVLSGTNRPGANTLKIAHICSELLLENPATTVQFLDLANLQPDIFLPSAYQTKPSWFEKEFQEPILNAHGAIIVTPEYNGGFPGVLKYFIDMLKFPESLVNLPVAFVGCAAGQFGALRPVEQLEILFHYRCAHIFGERVFIPLLGNELKDGRLSENYLNRLKTLTSNFIPFCRQLKCL